MPRAAASSRRSAPGNASVLSGVTLLSDLMNESSSVASVLQALESEARRLEPGARMPSVRSLMERHRVSPGTVRLAMARLAADGIIVARPGHGTFVGAQAVEAPAQERDFAWQGLALGASRIAGDAVRSLLLVAAPGAINLAGGYPSEDLQAVDLVARAMARATRRPGVWGRMPAEGLDALRAWFARQIGPSISP